VSLTPSASCPGHSRPAASGCWSLTAPPPPGRQRPCWRGRVRRRALTPPVPRRRRLAYQTPRTASASAPAARAGPPRPGVARTGCAPGPAPLLLVLRRSGPNAALPVGRELKCWARPRTQKRVALPTSTGPRSVAQKGWAGPKAGTIPASRGAARHEVLRAVAHLVEGVRLVC